jgi:hypothetical protein
MCTAGTGRETAQVATISADNAVERVGNDGVTTVEPEGKPRCR